MNASEKKRVVIRKGAFHCFRKAGYHATTIDDICQEAGISKGSFYWHYSSKQELFIDILNTWMREVVDELYRQFEDALRHEDYVTAITAAVTRETHRGRSIVPLLLEFSVQGLREPEVQLALSQFYRRIRFAISEMLRPVLKDRLTDSELEAVSATIFGAYSGLMIQDLCDPNQAAARETVGRFMSALRVWLRYETADQEMLAGLPPRTPAAPPATREEGAPRLEAAASDTPPDSTDLPPTNDQLH